jgi:hypothetical protein
MALTPELRQLLREKAQKVVTEMPPLTQEQIARLRVLMGGGR